MFGLAKVNGNYGLSSGAKIVKENKVKSPILLYRYLPNNTTSSRSAHSTGTSNKTQRNMFSVGGGDLLQCLDGGIRLAGVFQPLVNLKRYFQVAGNFLLGAVAPQFPQYEGNGDGRLNWYRERGGKYVSLKMKCFV